MFEGNLLEATHLHINTNDKASTFAGQLVENCFNFFNSTLRDNLVNFKRLEKSVFNALESTKGFPQKDPPVL